MRSEFTRNEYELAYPDGVENHYWNLARNHILLKTIQKLVLPTDKIIEVGCGRGGVVKYLRDRGLDCFGVELAECDPYEGAEGFIETNTDALHLGKERRDGFTVLMLLDVIEHIEDPDAFVRAILESYKNIRTLIITVPARMEIWSKYDEFYGHHERYDLEMSRAFLESAGFNAAYNRYFFTGLYAAARMALLLSDNRAVKVAAPKGILKLIHSAISKALIAEYSLMPKEIKGSSIISVGIRK